MLSMLMLTLLRPPLIPALSSPACPLVQPTWPRQRSWAGPWARAQVAWEPWVHLVERETTAAVRTTRVQGLCAGAGAAAVAVGPMVAAAAAEAAAEAAAVVPRATSPIEEVRTEDLCN